MNHLISFFALLILIISAFACSNNNQKCLNIELKSVTSTSATFAWSSDFSQENDRFKIICRGKTTSADREVEKISRRMRYFLIKDGHGILGNLRPNTKYSCSVILAKGNQYHEEEINFHSKIAAPVLKLNLYNSSKKRTAYIQELQDDRKLILSHTEPPSTTNTITLGKPTAGRNRFKKSTLFVNTHKKSLLFIIAGFICIILLITLCCLGLCLYCTTIRPLFKRKKAKYNTNEELNLEIPEHRALSSQRVSNKSWNLFKFKRKSKQKQGQKSQSFGRHRHLKSYNKLPLLPTTVYHLPLNDSSASLASSDDNRNDVTILPTQSLLSPQSSNESFQFPLDSSLEFKQEQQLPHNNLSLSSDLESIHRPYNSKASSDYNRNGNIHSTQSMLTPQSQSENLQIPQAKFKQGKSSLPFEQRQNDNLSSSPFANSVQLPLNDSTLPLALSDGNIYPTKSMLSSQSQCESFQLPLLEYKGNNNLPLSPTANSVQLPLSDLRASLNDKKIFYVHPTQSSLQSQSESFQLPLAKFKQGQLPHLPLSPNSVHLPLNDSNLSSDDKKNVIDHPIKSMISPKPYNGSYQLSLAEFKQGKCPKDNLLSMSPSLPINNSKTSSDYKRNGDVHSTQSMLTPKQYSESFHPPLAEFKQGQQPFEQCPNDTPLAEFKQGQQPFEQCPNDNLSLSPNLPLICSLTSLTTSDSEGNVDVSPLPLYGEKSLLYPSSSEESMPSLYFTSLNNSSSVLNISDTTSSDEFLDDDFHTCIEESLELVVESNKHRPTQSDEGIIVVISEDDKSRLSKSFSLTNTYSSGIIADITQEMKSRSSHSLYSSKFDNCQIKLLSKEEFLTSTITPTAAFSSDKYCQNYLVNGKAVEVKPSANNTYTLPVMYMYNPGSDSKNEKLQCNAMHPIRYISPSITSMNNSGMAMVNPQALKRALMGISSSQEVINHESTEVTCASSNDSFYSATSIMDWEEV
jgi:hypothetical protein